MGSGTQTAGAPFFIGIPSAPGKVPKKESKERFSCMITTTCLIVWIPAFGRASTSVSETATAVASTITARVATLPARFTRPKLVPAPLSVG